MRVTAEAKSRTRERILEAAVQLFGERGFEATTTRDVAQAARIAAGTLFNYFPSKEAIVMDLVSRALADAHTEFHERRAHETEPVERSFEQDLFAYVSAGLRKLKSSRKYVRSVVDLLLSPAVTARPDVSGQDYRTLHLETVTSLACESGSATALTPTAMQLYWTLFTGVFAFWTNDESPNQEDTLALLDESMHMFAGWLQGKVENAA
jgi:AcrR family transcriptional regulator